MKKARRTGQGYAQLGAILVLLLTASAARAQGPPSNCSQATLNGTYSLSGNGTIGAVAVATRGKVIYDGHGNGQATFTQSTGGFVQKFVAVPGVYAVNTDCTGSKTFNGTTTYDFTVTPDGREITWIVTNSGAVFAGTAVRQDNSGALHVTKECSQYTGASGSYCTITSSNLPAIKVGSKVIYVQAFSDTGFLATDIFLDAGAGNMAVGHCTIDAANFGLCTFSDGAGQFAGFHASIAVSPFSSSATEVNYHWEGTYTYSVR
ncbi:MAG: hypothetical protein ABI759_27385 [Candidatus Solibacter sp.]